MKISDDEWHHVWYCDGWMWIDDQRVEESPNGTVAVVIET